MNYSIKIIVLVVSFPNRIIALCDAVVCIGCVVSRWNLQQILWLLKVLHFQKAILFLDVIINEVVVVLNLLLQLQRVSG